jgi:hypothetical protein
MYTNAGNFVYKYLHKVLPVVIARHVNNVMEIGARVHLEFTSLKKYHYKVSVIFVARSKYACRLKILRP